MVSEILQFYVLRPNNVEQQSSFSGKVKTKVRLIYLHTGCGTFSKGGLRIFAEATSRLPK